MRFAGHPVVVRGGGDLGSGAVYQLHRAGFPVIVLELARPLAVRRTATFAPAAVEGRVVVEGIEAVRATSPAEAMRFAEGGAVAVLVSPDLPDLALAALVDARMAKRNTGTGIDQAPLVVALGPGFEAGVDCHAVIETARGHRLGRVIWSGRAAPNTGVPGRIGGEDVDRVVRAPAAGEVVWEAAIADLVEAGEVLGAVGGVAVAAPVSGVVRGLGYPGNVVEAGDKIGDIDPRGDPAACFEISDKSRLVGAGVLEAVLTYLDRA